jgi:hypothetical protein
VNELEIAERLIRAAEIEDRGGRVGPAPLKAQQFAYVHSVEDMLGWGKRIGERDFLRKEDADAHALHRREFWDRVSVSARDVSDAEEAWGWLVLVENGDHRCALAAWARCMADNKRQFFKDWCARTGISEKTGRKRKDRAIARIYAHLVRSNVQNSDNGSGDGLPDCPEMEHVSDTLGAGCIDRFTWRDDPAFRPIDLPDIRSFDWAAKRNAHRRKMQERRRRAAEKVAA